MVVTKTVRVKRCFFCKTKIEPDYKDPIGLKKFTTERGKILPKAKTGVCSKHQRWLGTQIKRARYLSLLPYIAQ